MTEECYHVYQYPSKQCLRCGKQMDGDWVTYQATDWVYTIDQYGRVIKRVIKTSIGKEKE